MTKINQDISEFQLVILWPIHRALVRKHFQSHINDQGNECVHTSTATDMVWKKGLISMWTLKKYTFLNHPTIWQRKTYV